MRSSKLVEPWKSRQCGRVAFELDYKVGSLPTSYMGLPSRAPHDSAGVWDPIEERF